MPRLGDDAGVRRHLCASRAISTHQRAWNQRRDFGRGTTAATSGIADELGGTLLFCLVLNFIDSR